MEHAAGYLFHIGPLGVTSHVTTMWGIMAVIAIISFVATRNMQRLPSGVQNIVEMVVEALLNFFGDILGEKKPENFCHFLLPCFFILFSIIRVCCRVEDT